MLISPLKIFQARLYQYVNWEHPNVWAGFRKGRRSRDQIANIHLIVKKARTLQKNIYFSIVDYTKTFICVHHNKLWKIFEEMEIQYQVTCLLRNLYASQEAIVRIRLEKNTVVQNEERAKTGIYIVTLFI